MYLKHKNDLIAYYQVTKLPPAAIIQTYTGSMMPNHRAIAPRPPIVATPISNAQATLAVPTLRTMNVNGQLRPITLSIVRNGQVVQQFQNQQIQQQSRIDQVIEQSLPQQVTVQPNFPNQTSVVHTVVQVSQPQEQHGNTAGGVVRVSPMPREQSVTLESSDRQCPFCPMRFSIRSDAYYQHVAVVHIPRILNDTPQAKVRCSINNCGFEFSDRMEQLQGSGDVSQTEFYVSTVHTFFMAIMCSKKVV